MKKISFATTFLSILTIFATNSFCQDVRCSYVKQTIGYLYDISTKEYKEEIRTFQRDKMCMGPNTIAIGAKTSYYMGNAISRIEEPNNTVYIMEAKDHDRKQLILEIAFTPNMTITAFYPEAFYIIYYIEDD